MKKELTNALINADMNNKDIVEINKDLMMQIHGGAKSSGYINSISGECNSSGKSCREALEDTIKGF